jgi:hypothetical protein
MNATPELLPVEFTGGVEVYKKEFNLQTLNGKMKQTIAENEDKFVVLSLNNRSIVALKRIANQR